MVACLIPKDASKVSLSSTGRSRDEYIEIPLDILAGLQLLDESAIQLPATGVVDFFKTGMGLFQLSCLEKTSVTIDDAVLIFGIY